MPVSDLDRSVGMFNYATQHEGVGGVVRSRAEDFEVEEIVTPGLLEHLSSSSRKCYRYAVFKVSKKDIDTFHACDIIGKALHRRVYYLGLKDSRAVATQFVSVREPSPERVASMVEGKVSIRLLGYAAEPLTRRDLVGNRFRIIVTHIRTPEKEAEEVVAEVREKACRYDLANFYGYRRFGVRRPVTHLVGREIVRGNPREAVEKLLTFTSRYEEAEIREYRKIISESLAVPFPVPHQLDVEAMVARRLREKPGDYFGALRAVPLRLRRLFVNAYQSYLFNLVLSEALGEDELHVWEEGDFISTVNESTGLVEEAQVAASRGPLENGKVPLVPLPGYAYRDGAGRFRSILKRVLTDEGVSPRSFFVKGLDEVSAHGGFRPAPLILPEFSTYSCHGVEASMVFNMRIPKGTYATTILREVMKPSDPFAAGF